MAVLSRGSRTQHPQRWPESGERAAHSRRGSGLAGVGAGTTLIAAEKAERVARLLELDPKYVDVIVRRWQDWTGELATRESDGAAYDELSVTGETSGKGVSSDERLSLEPAAASSWVRKLRQASALPASAWLARSLMRARISDPNLLEPAKCRSPI
ncbi:hypothetical protein CJO79_12165 [Ralstonia solanacearum]|nr:hypothetical protein CJO76_12185 [Ralstonia solanacearum]AXV91675.1 hypothetical protein CJO79_12165 [Ralstonia solanacearum]AXW19785.1 hypothetical protein CJO85_12225 [Ralstonia solanacearum]AXW76566.1 hypothetical protein CJO97_12155 [Ralstonia solanacearum]